MNRAEFMAALEAQLRDITTEEREEALKFYNHGFGRAAHKNGQHARGHRVQRSAVPNAPRTADAAQLCHYVKGGKALRFVDN